MRCKTRKCASNSLAMQMAKMGGQSVATKSLQKTLDSTSALISATHTDFIDWGFDSGGDVQAWAVEFYFKSNLTATSANGFIGKANGALQQWSIEINKANSGQIHIATQTDSTANGDASDMWLFEQGSTPNGDPIYSANTWVHCIVRHSDRGYSAGDCRNFDAMVDGVLYTYDLAGATGNDQAGGVAISRNNNVGKSINSTGDLVLMNLIEDNTGTDLNEKVFQLVLYNGLISTAKMTERYNAGVPTYPNQSGLPSKAVYKFEGNYNDSEGNLGTMTQSGTDWNFTTDTP